MKTVAGYLYGIYCALLFLSLGLTVLLINLFLPNLRSRRQVAGSFSRGFLHLAGVPFIVEGITRLPNVPCVVVSNHSSYLDGLIAAAALPPDFAFVIKKEMVRVPVASLLLKRLGSEFVERFDRHKGASDARRVLKSAANGQSLVFFPEGTFSGTAEIGKFHGGAFATATRSNMPVVVMAIHGARATLPAGTLRMRRHPIRVEVLQILEPAEARLRSRVLLAEAIREPLAQ